MSYELTTQNIWILSILLLLGVMVVGGFTLQPDFQSPKLHINETPIVKNSQLQLRSGEIYEYSYILNGTGTNITYEIVDGNDCTEIRITNGMGKSSVCIDKNGIDKKLETNATLSDPSFLLFKPWMLALSEGWNWNNTLYMNFNNKLTRMTTNTYHVMRMDMYRGRRVFVVKEADDGGVNQYDWIDYQKRVLLRANGPGYDLKMTSGLPLSNSTQ